VAAGSYLRAPVLAHGRVALEFRVQSQYFATDDVEPVIGHVASLPHRWASGPVS
jgi:hypothetical protein